MGRGVWDGDGMGLGGLMGGSFFFWLGFEHGGVKCFFEKGLGG